MYFYGLDRNNVKFEKQFAIPHVTKDDNQISKDIRLLNYIEQSLEAGNIQECHLYANQTSERVRQGLSGFIALCEAWIRLQMSIKTVQA